MKNSPGRAFAHLYQSLHYLGVSLLLACLALAQQAHASDADKEKRWADQIVDSLLVGEAVWLNTPPAAGTDKVLGLYTEHATEKAEGAAIIMHGIGIHPNWAEVIYPLRTQLPEYGWDTLSIQLPILRNEAETEEYAPLMDEVAPRIEAAIKYLKGKGIQNIVLIAHSLGTAMAADYLANKPDRSVQAFIGISMNQNDIARLDSATAVSKFSPSLPVLELYGTRDLKGVLKSVEKRATAARKSGLKRYQQLAIEDADHFYAGKEEMLVKRVRGWLAKNAAGTEIKRK